MNFTREPIIETIVSPKDGYKLCIRNSKMSGAEEFFVDAVEVVSFGHSLFFRGQERPKPFLVPVSDYEIFEVKETRVVLKNIAHERNIKIGGGREAPLKQPPKEVPAERKEEVEEVKEGEMATTAVEAANEPKNDRKRDRRRSRRRRLAEEKRGVADKDKDADQDQDSLEELPATAEEQENEPSEEVKVVVPSFGHLLPPPPVLISERLNQLRNKEMAEAAASGIAVEGEQKEELVQEVEASPEVSKLVLEEDDEDFPF